VIPRIDVACDAGAWPSPATVRALARRVRRAARAMGCTRAELDALALRIVDDDRMRALKAAHFGVAEATDVLSFPAAELPFDEGEAADADDHEDDDRQPGPLDTAFASLGEIVINRDAVARQATRPGLAGWLDEATALAIHGVAHLRGHDHDQRNRARRMRACERRGSRAVGLPCTRPYGGGA
jgi:probable rRNA maturation factor